ncbi:MAG: LacI family DNA-binding transcriptional regulator [Spirochaetes bacterium]|nr:LacI family DNA-binding transcriptional regulator [Spirochaetota bacterium]
MVGIKDVAKAAGVSISTVSRVLSNGEYVSDDVKERVHAAVEALQYRPNRVAQSLRSQKSQIIGLIVADIQNPFFTAVSRYVQDAAYENGISVFLCNTDEKADKESQYIDLMHEENVAGIILAPTHQSHSSINRIINLHIPVVVIDRQVENTSIDSVYIDNTAAAYKLTLHLLENGYRKISAIIGSGSTTGKLRYQGIIQALYENNIAADKFLLRFVNATLNEGYTSTLELLDSDNRPDALIATNGLLAAGAFRAFRERKISIPDEMGFACFDETIWTALMDPPITVISQPTQDLGRTAVELLLNKINDPSNAAREVMLKSTLIPRESTKRNGQEK